MFDKKCILLRVFTNKTTHPVFRMRHLIFISNHITRFTASPHRNENSITKRMYRAKRFHPRAIFRAPRFVILVAGPVTQTIPCFQTTPTHRKAGG